MTQLAAPETPAAVAAVDDAEAVDAVDAETAACPAASEATAAYAQTPRSTATRYRERTSYDRAAVHAVLDEALVCHVAFVVDGAPVVLPTVHARIGDRLYVHGSSGGRWAKLGGQPIGITVTLLDGLALGRSWMHHSAPFRCVVIHGTAQIVEDDDERFEAMKALIDHVAPGRSAESRPPNRRELAATTIVAVDLVEVSLKVRSMAPAVDEPEDLDGPYWAGVIPLRLVAGEPVPSHDLRPGIPVPDHAIGYAR
jgi:nitroimidazol reductase NimA-like FMN-containing flavoprotein (pyridoxamine 5'-phosphate oxidase superfamily)